MKPVHVTKHARKRIERGDKLGLRTKLTPEEVAELIHDPHSLQNGQLVYIYSPRDDETYEVVTARQKSTIITMYDTGRHESRVVDMVMRARAGAGFKFSSPPPLDSYEKDRASEVYLGTWKERKGNLRISELVEVGHLFGFFRDTPGVLESSYLHELIVSATTDAMNADLLSKTQAKKLHFFIDDQKNTRLGILPVWVSFTLLGVPYIGTPQSV